VTTTGRLLAALDETRVRDNTAVLSSGHGGLTRRRREVMKKEVVVH